MGVTGTIMMMVEQLGLAMIPPLPSSTPSRASGLTSGTTRGIPGTMRKAELLSTTVALASAARGANFRLMDAPALNRASSTSLEAVLRQFLDGVGLSLEFYGLTRAAAAGQKLETAHGKTAFGQQADKLLPDGPGRTHDGYAQIARHDTPPV